MNVVDNKDKNIEKALEMIRLAKEKDVDLAILPEMFNSPYENIKFLENAESKEESETLTAIANISKELEIHVLAGSIPEKVVAIKKEIIEPTEHSNLSDETVYNTSFLFSHNGEIIGFHRKMHLFDVDIDDNIQFKESDTLSAGSEITILKTEVCKIGVGVCYDVRFPELSRIMALKEAKILIFPGAFNLTTGLAHWELLFRARALDNQVFTVGVAPALNKDNSYLSYGHSIVCNPWGEVIAQAGFDEELIVVDIDLDEIEKVQKQIPVSQGRRTDVYQLDLR